jgi:hypothetical protein
VTKWWEAEVTEAKIRKLLDDDGSAMIVMTPAHHSSSALSRSDSP